MEEHHPAMDIFPFDFDDDEDLRNEKYQCHQIKDGAEDDEDQSDIDNIIRKGEPKDNCGA